MRIGVIGTGWGRMHVGAFRAAGADVVAICGRDPERTARVAAEEGIDLATTDPAQLVDGVDAVVVAGPDALHPAHVRLALGAGRHVLCEKPLARLLRDAEALAPLVAATDRACAMSLASRFLPPVAALRGWLDGRPVARVVATIENGFAAAAGDSGDFGGASHAIDLAIWLAGGGTASVTHRASTEPGIAGSWALHGAGWEVTFSAGYVPARGGWVISPVRATDDRGSRELAPGIAPEPGRREPWAEAHVAQAAAFLAVVAGAPWPRALARFDDGLAVQRVLAAALEAEDRPGHERSPGIATDFRHRGP